MECDKVVASSPSTTAKGKPDTFPFLVVIGPPAGTRERTGLVTLICRLLQAWVAGHGLGEVRAVDIFIRAWHLRGHLIGAKHVWMQGPLCVVLLKNVY